MASPLLFLAAARPRRGPAAATARLAAAGPARAFAAGTADEQMDPMPCLELQAALKLGAADTALLQLALLGTRALRGCVASFGRCCFAPLAFLASAISASLATTVAAARSGLASGAGAFGARLAALTVSRLAAARRGPTRFSAT